MKIELKPEWQTDNDANALLTLMQLCFRHQGGSTYPIIGFLLGLWDGDGYKPDLQLLCRRIGDEHFQRVLRTMRLIRRTGLETPDFFIEGSSVLLERAEYACQWEKVPMPSVEYGDDD